MNNATPVVYQTNAGNWFMVLNKCSQVKERVFKHWGMSHTACAPNKIIFDTKVINVVFFKS